MNIPLPAYPTKLASSNAFSWLPPCVEDRHDRRCYEIDFVYFTTELSDQL